MHAEINDRNGVRIFDLWLVMEIETFIKKTFMQNLNIKNIQYDGKSNAQYVLKPKMARKMSKQQQIYLEKQ